MPQTRIVTDAIGIGVGVASYGVSFGALGVSSGLDVLQTMALSLLMFTGASQFALVGVIAAGGSSAAAIVTAFFVGIRNFAYAVSMNDLLQIKGFKKLIAGHLTIDESTAMALLTRTRMGRMHFGRQEFPSLSFGILQRCLVRLLSILLAIRKRLDLTQQLLQDFSHSYGHN